MITGEAVQAGTCGHCGQPIRLVPWGMHYKWVRGKDTWKCQPTTEFPVRSHHPEEERS
jgi:hypothetical protein